MDLMVAVSCGLTLQICLIIALSFEGERILEYALAFDLLLGNTCFKKGDSHLITTGKQFIS